MDIVEVEIEGNVEEEIIRECAETHSGTTGEVVVDDDEELKKQGKQFESVNTGPGDFPRPNSRDE